MTCDAIRAKIAELKNTLTKMKEETSRNGIKQVLRAYELLLKEKERTERESSK